MARILKQPILGDPVDQVDKNDRMDWTPITPDEFGADDDRVPDWGTPPDARPWIPSTPPIVINRPDGSGGDIAFDDMITKPDYSDGSPLDSDPSLDSLNPKDEYDIEPPAVDPNGDSEIIKDGMLDGNDNSYWLGPRNTDFVGTEFEDQYNWIYEQIHNQINWAFAMENIWETLGFSMNVRDYILNLVDTYKTEVANLYAAYRDYVRNLPATEAQLMEDAGLNPDLLGVNGSSGGSGSGAGAGGASMPTLRTNEQPIEHMLDIVNSISSLVGLGTEVAEAASTIKLQDSQAELNRVNASNEHQLGLNDAYQLAAEYVMQTYDPTPDESGSIPKFGVKSIPGVPEPYQRSAVSFAERFAASDYFFSERDKLSADAANSAFDYATILANPLYSSNFDDMTSIIADYSRIELDLRLSMYDKEMAMMDLNSKYMKLLSPQLMAAAQNGMNLSQVEYYANFDAAAAANSANKEAGFRGEYYENLDANVASDFENYQKEYLKLEAEINKVLSDTQITLLNRKRADLNSPNPMRRYMAARALQRINARSNRRMSETPTQRGNSTLQGAMDAGVKASLIGSNIVGAGAGAAGAELLPYVVSGTY